MALNIHLFVLLVFVTIITISSSIDHNINQCECNHIKCYDRVNEKNCLLMKGKYKPKSLTKSDCNCCSYCLIQNGNTFLFNNKLLMYFNFNNRLLGQLLPFDSIYSRIYN